MDKTKLYQHSGDYAREHNELEEYRASCKANIACKETIETAIRDNYHNNCLGKDAVKQVTDQFGYDRTLYVLAETVREKDWDGRISRDNKDWAKTVPVSEDKDTWGNNRNLYFVVDSVNPGLTNIFINQARHEYLLTLPLTSKEIEEEAARLLRHLRSEREPNSPSETHFMAQISPDFLIRASTKDQDRLFAMLPFKSLSFSSLKDRKGIFAFIQKNENRDQTLHSANQLSQKIKDAQQKSETLNKSSVPCRHEVLQK